MDAPTDLEFGSSAGVIFLMEADICESMDSCLWTGRPLDVARFGAERLGDPSSKLDKPESCCSKGDSQDRFSGTAGSWDMAQSASAYPLGTRSRSGKNRPETSPDSLRMVLSASAEAVWLTRPVYSTRFEASNESRKLRREVDFRTACSRDARSTLLSHAECELLASASDDAEPGAACVDDAEPPGGTEVSVQEESDSAKSPGTKA